MEHFNTYRIAQHLWAAHENYDWSGTEREDFHAFRQFLSDLQNGIIDEYGDVPFIADVIRTEQDCSCEASEYFGTCVVVKIYVKP